MNDTINFARPHWLRRAAFGLLVLVLAFAAVGFLYENISEARNRRFNPAQGRRVMVTGPDGTLFHMHIDCGGEGTPTVVLDSGLGDSYMSWRKVQPQVAKFTRVCSYDRAGIAYSEPGSQPRTSETIAQELHALLQAAGIPPPYILVAHSMGGYDVRVFVERFRKDVAGMVLVDASHPDQENRLPAELKNMQGSWLREAEFLEYTMPFGIPRLMGFCDEDPVARAAECNYHSAHEAVAEMQSFRQSASEAAANTSLGELPLAVLSHDPDKPSSELPPDLAKSANEAWEKMQEELAHLSSRGTQKIAKNASNYIQIDRPDLVVEAIHTVADQARASEANPLLSK